MRKQIAAINMTLDGFCDHAVMIADDEIDEHYKELFVNSDALLFGRITYSLMETYWPSVVTNPTGNPVCGAIARYHEPKKIWAPGGQQVK